jgi:hypothetical protein
MSGLPELTLDEIFNYCFFSGRADVAFNKDRDSGIFVVRYEFPLTEPRMQRKFLWILYHPYSFDPIDAVIKKVLEAIKSSKIIRIVNEETGVPSMVIVSRRGWFKEYTIKYEVSPYRILLPGDILAYSINNNVDLVKLRTTYVFEGRKYPCYFALASNHKMNLGNISNLSLPIFHILLLTGAHRVASMLESITTPSIYEVIKREILEDYHEFLSLKYTIFAIEALKELGEAFAREAQQKSS